MFFGVKRNKVLNESNFQLQEPSSPLKIDGGQIPKNDHFSKLNYQVIILSVF